MELEVNSEGALCALHPDRRARAICGRCGTFCCADCLFVARLCRACSVHEDTTPPSALAIAAALVGLASLFCGFVFGIVAIVLGQIELSRIAKGAAPATGQGAAQAGRALGALSLTLGALVFLSWWLA